MTGHMVPSALVSAFSSIYVLDTIFCIDLKKTGVTRDKVITMGVYPSPFFLEPAACASCNFISVT